MTQTDLKSPLKKAKGLGSAHEGVHHYLALRVTALALIPLVIWFVLSVVSLQGASYAEFTTWLASPVNAIMAILFVIVSFYHGVLGGEEIIHDYLHCKWFKMMKLIGQKLFFFALGVATIFAILKIAFAG